MIAFNKYYNHFNFVSTFLIAVSLILLIFKGLNFGIDDFGKSAPYKEIYNYFGLTVDNIVKKTKNLIEN